MGKKILLMVLLLPVIALGTANAVELKNIEAKQQMTTKSASTKPIVIRQSQRTFKIELPSNATTGYQWVLKSDYNTSLIKAKGYEYIVPKPKSGKALIGAPGMAVFKFEVNNKFKAAPQILDLHFAYIRFWDALDQPNYKTIQIISAAQ
ncbi:MAG: putative secreted protein [Francisellaceae bacterium]|jgi:predicted secreted protein